MSWDDNVYDCPEKHGLRIIGTVDFSSGDYEFDYTTVWADEAGQLYYASDSGCSCPSPFEDYTSVEHLAKGDFWEIEAELQKGLSVLTEEWEGREFISRVEGEVNNLLSKLRSPSW